MPPNEIIIEKDRRPSFSIIMPTFGDPEALARSIGNIAIQRWTDSRGSMEREILVIGDGFEEKAKEVCTHMAKYVKQFDTRLKLLYAHTKAHNGTGNIPRNLGLKAARNDWVIFGDAGTGFSFDMFDTLEGAILKQPEAKIITWEMVQMLDPVPIVTNPFAHLKVDRSKGLPYVLPGCACAVKREWAQQVEWPNVGASDWAYFDALWKVVFGEPEDGPRVESDVVIIPWTLTIAYGARTARKVRWPLQPEEYENLGYSLGYAGASKEMEMVEIEPKIIVPSAEEVMDHGVVEPQLNAGLRSDAFEIGGEK